VAGIEPHLRKIAGAMSKPARGNARHGRLAAHYQLSAAKEKIMLRKLFVGTIGLCCLTVVMLPLAMGQSGSKAAGKPAPAKARLVQPGKETSNAKARLVQPGKETSKLPASPIQPGKGLTPGRQLPPGKGFDQRKSGIPLSQLQLLDQKKNPGKDAERVVDRVDKRITPNEVDRRVTHHVSRREVENLPDMKRISDSSLERGVRLEGGSPRTARFVPTDGGSNRAPAMNLIKPGPGGFPTP
jgi:hypothetical protein